MAKIPRLGGGDQVANLGAVAAPSVQQAGIVGRAISGLAGQAIDLTKNLERARSKAETDNFKDTNTMDYYLEADTIVADMKKNPEFADNAKGFAQETRRRLDELKSGILSESPSSEAGSAFEDSIRRYEVKSNLNAQDFERSTISTQFRNNRVESFDKLALQAYVNPDPLEMMQRMEESFTDMESAVGNEISQNEFDALRDSVRTKMLNSTVEGMLEGAKEIPSDNAGDSFHRKQSSYQAIRNMVKNDSVLFGAIKEPAQEAKIMKYINTKQREDFALEIKAEAYQEKQEKKIQEELEDVNVADLMERAEAGEDISQDARGLLRTNGIDIRDFNMLSSKFITPAEKDLSARTRFLHSVNISEGNDRAAIKKDVIRDVMTGKLSEFDGQKLLTELKSRTKTTQTPAQKLSERNADRKLKAELTNPMFKTKNGEIKFADAMIQRTELVEAGVPLMQANDAVIREFSSPENAEFPTQGEDFDKFYMDRALKIKKSRETGAIDKDEEARLIKNLLKMKRIAGFPTIEELLNKAEVKNGK